MNKSGIGRVFRAFWNSVDGLKSAFASEAAFRQEALLVAILIPVALVVEVSDLAKALMIGSLLLILIVELINTAVEAAIDRISEEKHDLSKKAKDVASAAVLVAFINAACVWVIILTGM